MQRINFDIRLASRLLARYVGVWVADAVSLAITALIMPGVYFLREGPLWYLTPFWVALLFGLLNALIRPVLIILLLPITFVTLGLATLALNAALFYGMHLIVGSFVIVNFGAAVVGVLVLTLVNTLLGNLLQLGDDYSFYATLMDKFSSLTRPKQVRGDDRGLILLQIDGLSYGTLKSAVRRGHMPFVSATLKRRHAAIRKWFPGLPSQTSAVQAGVFYGNNFDIPGFRWYDKDTRKLVESSSASDMKALDDRYENVDKPLLKNGTCINSIIHGGAAKKILTVSGMTEKDLKHHRGSLEDFAIFSLHPYLYTRTILLMTWDFLVDRGQAALDFFKRRKPRLSRGIKFSFLRAVGNAFFREATTYFIMEDIVRGIPVIYANYIGYDMVAHYGGPNSWDAFTTLTGIDRQIKKISRTITRKARKHYDLVVMSDHGQSACVPFKNIYGKSLPKLIEENLQRPMLESGGQSAELGYFNTLLREIRMVEAAYGTRPIRSSRRTLERLHKRVHEEQVEPGADEGVVVCVNGPLAHVYFTESPNRVTTETLLERHPTLLAFLVAHEGIGFVLTTNADGEHIMMSKGGMRRLRSGTVEGTDPVAPYTSKTREKWLLESLVRISEFPHSGDLILNGSTLADGKVVSFEAQRGTHGGLGGEQTDAFVVFPSRFRTWRDRLRNPSEMHRFLSSMLEP